LRRVDHQHVVRIAVRPGQSLQHPTEYAAVAPPQTVAIDEDQAARNLHVIGLGSASGVREEVPDYLHLPVRQPEEVAHFTAPFFGSESVRRENVNGL